MRIALATERPKLGDIEANLKTLTTRVAKARADLVVFGELYLSGYALRDAVTGLAQSVKGDVVGRIQDVCKANKKGIVVGFPRRDDDRRGVVYDSALFVDKKGNVDWYDKWFLANFGPFEEKLYFANGNRLPLFDLDGVKIGVHICYDLFFPELIKAQAILGADVLLNISASPTTSRKSFELLFPARALENGCYFAYCNVAGTQEDLVFWGGSQVWGPRGDRKVLAPYTDPSLVVADIDLGEIEAARPLRPTIRDTRADMAQALVRSLQALER